MEIIFFIVFAIFIINIIMCNFDSHPKIVPPNSIYIIDRDTHYYKTLTAGQRVHLTRRDKITTRISTAPIKRVISDYYETEDGGTIYAEISCTYASNDILNTQDLLKSVRRSIDDIIQSSVYFAAGSLKSKYTSTSLHTAVKVNLEKELNSLDVKLIDGGVSFRFVPNENGNIECFKPHISGCYHASVETKDSFSDGPIKYY